MVSVKQGGIKYHFLSLWYDSTWDFVMAFASMQREKMEQMLQAYGFLKEPVTTTMMLYKNTRIMVHSSDGDINFFDIVTGVLQGDTLTLYMFITCLDYVLRTSIDLIKYFHAKKRQEADDVSQSLWQM